MKDPFHLIAIHIFVAGLSGLHAGVAAADPGSPEHPGSEGGTATAVMPVVTITAATPSVDVAPARTGRQFVDLPALEYAFEVEARCFAGWSPESLSVSVADSRVAVGAGQLADQAHHNLVLRIPARQLAPVAIHDFCQVAAASPAPAPDDSPRTLKAVLSANASLVCRSEARRKIVYASQPLDLILNCRAGGTADDAAGRRERAYGVLFPSAR